MKILPYCMMHHIHSIRRNRSPINFRRMKTLLLNFSFLTHIKGKKHFSRHHNCLQISSVGDNNSNNGDGGKQFIQKCLLGEQSKRFTNKCNVQSQTTAKQNINCGVCAHVYGAPRQTEHHVNACSMYK